jgi:hypothetical protein
MKNICRILPILLACLVLTPLFAAGQLAYPENFLKLSIPQLPGSKVVEVRREGNVPVTVVLESEDTAEGRHVVIFYTLDSKPFRAAWDYDHDRTKDLESAGILETEGDTVNMVYVNKVSGKDLLITILPKGSKGSRIELTYPWLDKTENWFMDLLEKGVDPKKPDKK